MNAWGFGIVFALLALGAAKASETPAADDAVGARAESFRDCDVCPEMVVIAPGAFVMDLNPETVYN